VKYETLENALMKEIRLLRKTLIIVLISFTLLSLIMLASKNKIFVEARSQVSTRPLLTYVCEQAFLSIGNNKPINAFLAPEIQNALKKSDFKVSVDEVLMTQEVDVEKCRIIIKGGDRVRAFLVSLIKDSSFDFYYKLSEINEIEVNKEDLKMELKNGDKK
jgi:hypothetical protein